MEDLTVEDKTLADMIHELVIELEKISDRLSSINRDLDIIRAHLPEESSYIHLGTRYLYPDASMVNTIKEMMQTNLLKEKEELRQRYYTITNQKP